MDDLPLLVVECFIVVIVKELQLGLEPGRMQKGGHDILQVRDKVLLEGSTDAAVRGNEVRRLGVGRVENVSACLFFLFF